MKSYFDEGKYSEAIHAAKKLLALNKDSIEALKIIGRCCTTLRELDEAEFYLNKVLKKCPKDFEAIKDLGNLYHAKGKINLAKTFYRKSILINNRYAPALTNLGSLELLTGNHKEAMTLLSKAIKYDPNLGAAWSNISNAYLNLGKAKEAEHTCRQAIKLSPNLANTHFLLSSILIRQKKLKEAETSLRKAIQLKPDFFNAYLSLGSILKNSAKPEEAEIFTRKAIDLKPDSANAYLNLGAILLDLGKLEEAKLFAKKAIVLKPDFATAHANLSGIYLKQGKLEDAATTIAKAIDIEPMNNTFKSNLLNLLTMGTLKNKELNPLIKINEEFKMIALPRIENNSIKDQDVTKIYLSGLNLYEKYNLKLESSSSQIYKRNNRNLKCQRHKLIFNKHKIIPEFCFSCYKVQIELGSIIDLIKLYTIFEAIELKNNNLRKCMIELRPNIKGFYKGLIYCSNLEEANQILNTLDPVIKQNISPEVTSKVKRGCSEYTFQFPIYEKINKSGSQPMSYNESWRNLEKEIDQEKRDWGHSIRTVEGFNLNNFLVIRNWIAYAIKIGDKSVKKITSEKIEGGLQKLQGIHHRKMS